MFKTLTYIHWKIHLSYCFCCFITLYVGRWFSWGCQWITLESIVSHLFIKFRSSGICSLPTYQLLLNSFYLARFCILIIDLSIYLLSFKDSLKIILAGLELYVEENNLKLMKICLPLPLEGWG